MMDESTPELDENKAAGPRKQFHEHDAATLAKSAGMTTKQINGPTEKFAYFEDGGRFMVIAGAQEKHTVEAAFARGLGLRGDRKLILVLPERQCFATMQRAPWFKEDARPEIWSYGKSEPVKRMLRTREETEEEVRKRLKPGETLASELRKATTAKHLGEGSEAVWHLVEWATAEARLDPSHRKGERSWQCMGQRVLSITGTKSALKVRAGIHYGGANAPVPLQVSGTSALTDIQVMQVRDAVEAGIEARLQGPPPIHKPDEHWLQAVIRRDPTLVGVEQPALREFPAWRPRDGAKRLWGRGFIDLLGVDGHGDIRVVETKLASNADELLIFQGLDYYIWARVYIDELRQRLSAHAEAQLEIHYVVGDDKHGKIRIAKHAPAQAHALEGVPWRFQSISDWYRHPDTAGQPTSELLGKWKLPT